MANIEVFQAHILEAGVLDPPKVHHEFVSGKHGRKLDFDTIETGSDLYNEWVDVNVGFIVDEFPRTPEVILGVANGTNRLSLDVARRFNGQSLGLVSEKDPRNSKILSLNWLAARVIRAIEPELVVVVEDVGTTGSNSVQVAVQARELGAKKVIVVPTWQRQPSLGKLDEAGISYVPIIGQTLPTFDKEDCEINGFCAEEGMLFIPREK